MTNRGYQSSRKDVWLVVVARICTLVAISVGIWSTYWAIRAQNSAKLVTLRVISHEMLQDAQKHDASHIVVRAIIEDDDGNKREYLGLNPAEAPVGMTTKWYETRGTETAISDGPMIRGDFWFRWWVPLLYFAYAILFCGAFGGLEEKHMGGVLARVAVIIAIIGLLVGSPFCVNRTLEIRRFAVVAK